MNFGDNEKCQGFLLGTENKGMRLMFQMMNEARVYVGMQGLALASAAYEKAVRYANERLQGPDVADFKNPDAPSAAIVKHPDVRRMLMTMKTYIDGMRSLFLTVAYYQDKVRTAVDEKEAFLYTGMVELLTPVCKAYGSDRGFEMCIEGMQVLGGYGYCTEYEIEGLARDAKIASIYEGANGIQALDLVGRKLGMKGGQYFMNYIFEINKFMKANKDNAAMADVAAAVNTAKTILAKLTMKFGKMVRKDLRGTLQWAVPYLKLFGHVAVSYELLKQGVLASEKLEALYAAKGLETDEAKAEFIKTNPDGKFYNGKILEAKYFAATVLPEVPALEAAILSKDTSCLEFPFEMEI
jgi:acyl-CoA dehydrogenase-like protein/acetyl-CoA dehydrogenase-like protein